MAYCDVDCDYQDVPVCPHCGNRVENDWHEYYSRSEESVRITCGKCDKVYDCDMQVEYTFTSTIPDLEAEAAKRRQKEESKTLRRQEFLVLAAAMPPGTRVKVSGDYDGRSAGKTGTIANQELSRHHNFIEVDFDEKHHGDLRLLRPQELEVIPVGVRWSK